jgi:threonine synthase
MSTRPSIAVTSRLTGMACLRCAEPWPVAEYEAGCPSCAAEGHASNLRLTYAPGAPGVVLAYPGALSLGEGGTPLVELPELASELKLGKLSAKLEWCNPTGSHKDRMSAQLIARALDRGAPRVVAASSGNGGLSVAAYAARAGIAAEIAVTDALPRLYRKAITAHGATLVSFADGMARWRHLAKRVEEGAFAATNYKVPAIGTNPFGIEGYKTIAAELASGTMPDLIVVPCSRGDLLSGIRLGFEEIGADLPILVAAEPFSRLQRVLAGADYREQFAGDTAQASIAGSTVTWQAAEALRASAGRAVPVDDGAARTAQWRLATCGLHAELSAASALAALATLAQGGALTGRHAVIVLTGAGSRDPGDTDLAARPRNEAASEGALAQPATTGASPQRTELSVQQKRENG